MSWNGTVRCSWCYEKGHNRLGCPERKEHIKENPDCYEARREEKRKAKAKVRRCSYCEEPGHNRKTCKEMKVDRLKFVNKNMLLRKTVLNWMKDAGVGIGSLITVARDYWNPSPGCDTEMLFVDHISWVNVRVGTWRMSEIQGPKGWSTSLFAGKRIGPEMANERRSFRRATPAALISVNGAVEARHIEMMVPEGWKAATDEETVARIEEDLKGNTMEQNRQWTLHVD